MVAIVHPRPVTRGPLAARDMPPCLPLTTRGSLTKKRGEDRSSPVQQLQEDSCNAP